MVFLGMGMHGKSYTYSRSSPDCLPGSRAWRTNDYVVADAVNFAPATLDSEDSTGVSERALLIGRRAKEAPSWATARLPVRQPGGEPE